MNDDRKRLLRAFRRDNVAGFAGRMYALEEKMQRLERAMADLEARIERLESPTQ